MTVLTDTRPTDPAVTERAPARSTRNLGWLLLIGGLIGLLASAVLLIEKIELIRDPDYIPTCSFNPVMACGSVMTSWQGEVFGIPNPIIGVAAFPMVMALGAALLAGARPARWFWGLFLAGTTFGALMVTWLAHQSLYSIGFLCPYCMVVWAVTIPIFVFTLAHVASGRDQDPDAHPSTGFGGTVLSLRWVLIFFWFGLWTALILVRFWDYWSTLF
ncbi:MAG: vitamin K epoxide reductase family protein [Actinomycetia bacterium]|nr:vitamin K epoxide reductase family protein [Actinomycetes bacterium]